MLAENIDILVLTTIIVLLFLIFIIATFKEMAEAGKKPFKGGKEKSIRAVMIENIGKIFTDESIEPMEKQKLMDLMKKNMAELDEEE